MSTDLYREVRGAGPVLLLIPGGNGDAGFYEPFAKALSGDFTVISYDRRGFSRSFRTGPPSRWQICSARRSSIPGGHIGYRHHPSEFACQLRGLLAP
jgi:pimeloyl-ACP methyl ester carboxylesterase